MPNHFTLLELLQHRCKTRPQRIVYTFLADGETESGNLSYEELDRQARAIAVQLQNLRAGGSRALLVYPYSAGLEFIAAFFGCLYAGVVAVTENPPRSSQSLVELQERIEASGATVALTTQSLLSKIKSQKPGFSKKPGFSTGGASQKPGFLEKPGFSTNWIPTDIIPMTEAEEWIEPNLDGDTIAYMQYTSGSTGTPKGVMVTHSNILHNSAVIYQCFQHSQTTSGAMWLPMFHDMGLVGGVIQPIYSDRPTVLMSPVALIQRPWRWLEAISRYRATTSGGPNFAYDLLWRQATPEKLANLDLSCWEVAFSGAEPVRAETLERFAETFAPCGFRRSAFYPCYGLAEATLFVSGGWKDSAPQVKYVDAAALAENRVVEVSPEAGGKAMVSCGKSWLGSEVAIADPETLTPLPENRVGEILIAGPGVAKGYWGQPEETERTFGVYLGEGKKRGPFLRSGDLGFLSGGELFITGRIKELMIFWGRNRYPQEIEQTVEKCHPGLRFGCGAAFSIEVEGEEKLVVAFEVERSYLRKLNVEEVVGAIRQAVAEERTVDVWAIALLKTGSIPKTTSGKIRRGECRRQFLAGSLSVVGEWQTAEAGNFLDLLNL